MFVSHPQYRFTFPPAFEHSGSEHWRMVELTLHVPWFLVSVEIIDADEPECRVTRTLCIAREHDLADVLRSVDVAGVKGIVCMMPAWQSATGQWTSREIREVWLRSSPAGKHVVLCDTAGRRFECGVIPGPTETVAMEFLLKVATVPPPGAPGVTPAVPRSHVDAHKDRTDR